MAPFRRPRSLEPSDGLTASTSTSQTQPGTPRSVSPSSQSQHGLFKPSIDRDAAIARMKDAATAALEVVQTGSRLAGDATSDVAIPGLSIGLKALAEILRKVQTMNTTITGVQELHNRIVDLVNALKAFRSQAGDQPLHPQMLERMSQHETKWQEIAERAEKIKSHGKIKRFLTSDADAKALQGLVDEMDRSIQDDMLVGIRNIERDVVVLGNNVETVREDVGRVLVDVGAVREGLEGIGEDVEGLLGEISVVQDDIAGVGENMDAVRHGVQGVGDGVEALQEGVDVVAGNMKALRENVTAIDANVQEVKLQVAKAVATKLDKSFLDRYAKMAPYYANEVRRSCLEGTRVEFLQDIYTWITAACEGGKAIPTGGIVMWINGLGGTGKTTVAAARSVAEWCDLRKLLGGSFFCSHSDNECSDPSFVFPTLCRQLCSHHQPFKDKVQEVLERDPNIVSYGLYRQFEELIVRPLEMLESPFPRSVYVFDALDELKDKDSSSAKSTILSVIAKFVPRIAKFLLFIITSRPEADITALFEAKRRDSLKNTTTPLLLRNIPIDLALRDIKLYIDHEFEGNVGFLGVEPEWPSAEEKNTLAEQSQGLFIYVATAIKFIMDKTHRDPKGRMDLLATPMANLAPHEFLFSLYTTILVASYEEVSPDHVARLRDVLSAVVLAQEPLSPLSVARLVGLDVTRVRSTLTGLHSVLHVPTHEHEPIRIIHPTFPEFLLSSEAAPHKFPDTVTLPTHLHLQPAERHWYLFSRCIEVMSGVLKRDMIGIRYPALFQSEIDNLKERVRAAVEPHVSYSCRFWANHFRDGIEGAATLDVSQSFRNFVHKMLLFWIETCALLDAMEKVTFTLDTTRDVCQMLGGQFADLMSFLADCHRFVLSYSPCIYAAPLQLYYFALSIAPTASHIRKTYSHERLHALVVEHGASNWAPCLDILVMGTSVRAVAFSSDGSWFVTGDEHFKVTIWNTATRTPVVSFEGHTSAVRCVAFSPHGLQLASGGDYDVRVWQTQSRELVHILKGHTFAVNSVVYSGDGRRLLSATWEGEVKLWDSVDGRCLFTLDKTGNTTFQVGFSSDGGIIARGDGASVYLHHVSSATSDSLEFPDTVKACMFSPDGRYITARSEHVIKVWTWPDKTMVRSIDVPGMLFGRLAFSSDDTLVGCGSSDGPIRLWPVASGDPPCVLHGHGGLVSDLACSPDRAQMISVADDSTMRVWDGTLLSIPAAEQPMMEPSPLPPALGPPRFALIKLGDQFIALIHLHTLEIDIDRFALSFQMPECPLTVTLFPNIAAAWDTAIQASVDRYKAVCPWSFLTGQQHTRISSRPFAISLDNSFIAYSSLASDNVVIVYNLRTRTVAATLTVHTKEVRSVVFSPDNALLATGTGDGSTEVWDTVTGALVYEHAENMIRTDVVVFSPNGNLVASGCHDKIVSILDLSTKHVIRIWNSHRREILNVMFATDNTHVVVLDGAHWVYVWDITTGIRVGEFCLSNHNHLLSPICSPDDTGILIAHNDGTFHTVSLWQPGTRTWPAYHVSTDGWVYVMSPGKIRRLGWLPLRWRIFIRYDSSMLYTSDAVTVPNTRRRMMVLNMSQLVEYIDNLDTSL